MRIEQKEKEMKEGKIQVMSLEQQIALKAQATLNMKNQEEKEEDQGPQAPEV